MLTKSQIQRIAQRTHIGMRAQERDYVHHLLLWLVFSQGQSVALGGGSALQLAYGGNRYAEELSFGCDDVVPPSAELLQDWAKICRRLEDFGVVAKIRDVWQSPRSSTFEINFRGPLFDGSVRSEGRLHIAVDREPQPFKTRRELVSSEYADLRPFVVTVAAPEELIAEAIRALMVWAKPRDLYDLWMMLGMGTKPDHELIERKLSRHGIHWRLQALIDSLDSVQTGWERDLRHLLPQYVPFEVVKEGVVRRLVGV